MPRRRKWLNRSEKNRAYYQKKNVRSLKSVNGLWNLNSRNEHIVATNRSHSTREKPNMGPPWEAKTSISS